MRTKEECLVLMSSSIKQKEKMLNMKILNGQAVKGINQTVLWVIDQLYN